MGKVKKLNTKQIDKHLLSITEWKISPKKNLLTKKIEFSSFVNGLAFMAKVAVHAEIMQHHPVIELREDGLTIKLSTTSVKGLSVKDFELAKKIDNLRII